MKISAIKLQIYLLDNKAWHILDNIFDKMHKQSYLKYSMEPTFFRFSEFVVYKTDA